MRIPGAFGPREGVSMGIHYAASGKWTDLPERAQGFKERKKIPSCKFVLNKIVDSKHRDKRESYIIRK